MSTPISMIHFLSNIYFFMKLQTVLGSPCLTNCIAGDGHKLPARLCAYTTRRLAGCGQPPLSEYNTSDVT